MRAQRRPSPGRVDRRVFPWLLLAALASREASAGPPCAHLPADDPESLPCEVAVREPAAKAPGEPIRVVTFNVHFGADVASLARAVRQNPRLRTADVLLLQEIESHPGARRPALLAEALGLNVVYAPARGEGEGTHGLAILSRLPLTELETLRLERYDLFYGTRRRIALGATVDLGGRPLRLYNVHLETRLTLPERIKQIQPVVQRASSRPLAVIGGDVNTINSVSSLLPALPLPLPGFSQDGLFDCFMRDHGFSTPFANIGATRPLQMRLDGLYARGLRVESFDKENDVRVSDHLPLWMDVRLN